MPVVDFPDRDLGFLNANTCVIFDVGRQSSKRDDRQLGNLLVSVGILECGLQQSTTVLCYTDPIYPQDIFN